MAQLDKLIARLCARPTEMDFADVEALLRAFGYIDQGGKGSHHAFRKPDSRTITVPTVKGRKVKREYLDYIRETLELDD